MGGIGSLAPTRPQQAALPEAREEGLKEQLLGLSLDQSSPEFDCAPRNQSHYPLAPS